MRSSYFMSREIHIPLYTEYYVYHTWVDIKHHRLTPFPHQPTPTPHQPCTSGCPYTCIHNFRSVIPWCTQGFPYIALQCIAYWSPGWPWFDRSDHCTINYHHNVGDNNKKGTCWPALEHILWASLGCSPSLEWTASPWGWHGQRWISTRG